MKSILSISLLLLLSCSSEMQQSEATFSTNDTKEIQAMVKEREAAMINRDIDRIVQQFDSNATFINGGGFYYEGIEEIRRFHESMFHNDTLVYTYKAGNLFINPVRNDLALAYYPWQQNWTMKQVKSDTFPEIGLMTIVAVKENGKWKWQSITNQRTKEYFNDLPSHKAPK